MLYKNRKKLSQRLLLLRFIYFCMLAADILSLSSKRVHAHRNCSRRRAFVHFMPEWQCESATHPSLLS
jgi:hypothetical protein